MSTLHDEIDDQELHHEVVSTPLFDGNVVKAQTESPLITSIPVSKHIIGQELPEHKNHNVMTIGKIGTGKSSTIFCLVGRNEEGQAGWEDGNHFRRKTCTISGGLITINDAQGYLKHDWLLRQAISEISPEKTQTNISRDKPLKGRQVGKMAMGRFTKNGKKPFVPWHPQRL